MTFLNTVLGGNVVDECDMSAKIMAWPVWRAPGPHYHSALQALRVPRHRRPARERPESRESQEPREPREPRESRESRESRERAAAEEGRFQQAIEPSAGIGVGR